MLSKIWSFIEAFLNVYSFLGLLYAALVRKIGDANAFHAFERIYELELQLVEKLRNLLRFEEIAKISEFRECMARVKIDWNNMYEAFKPRYIS